MWYWSSVDLNGLLPLTLLVFSCPDDPGCEPIRSLSSSPICLFLPQILHATIARPPTTIAPPMPTTTPMIIRFEEELSPELLELLSPPLKPGDGVDVDVDTGTTALVVKTCSRV